MEGMPRAVPVTQAWDELLTLARDEAGERPMLERLLDLWRHEHGADSVRLPFQVRPDAGFEPATP